jgi:methyl-accepting chemotaxis protein
MTSLRLIASMSIKTKVTLGFGLVLAILLAVAATSYLQFLGAADSFRIYAQRVSVVSVSRDIDRNFLEMRRNVREFALTGVAEDATAALASADLVRAAIAKGLATSHVAERRRRLEEISTQYEDYRKGVERVFVLKRDLDKLTSDTLDPSGREATDQLLKLADAADKAGNAAVAGLARQTLQALMQVRLNVNKVIGRRDDAAAQQVDQYLVALSQAVGELDKMVQGGAVRASLDDARRSIVSYGTAYRDVAGMNREVVSQINGNMKHAAETIAAAAAAVDASGMTDQQGIEVATLAAISFTQTVLLVLALGGLALGMLAAWLIGGGISRPVLQMVEAMRRLAAGDLTVTIPARDRGDEVGRMAEAMVVFHHNAEEAQRLEGEAERVRVAKDRRQSAIDQHTQDFGTAATGVMAMLVQAAETMRKTAGEMTAAAQQTRETAERTAGNANASAQNLSAVAAAAEEMSASIQEISQQVARATQAAHEAVERTSATDAKVAGMAAAAERVGDVVRLISDIAGQTNLLALNATIEAARAGDAGKGFAVVASEVKALATQTAKATDEIASQIAAIRTATGEAVEAVREVGTAIGQVNEVAAAIAAAVEEQSATTREIAASVQTVTGATQEATQAMHDVASVSETTEVASQTVQQNCDEVGRTADVLRSELTQFLEAIAKTDDADRRRYERISGAGNMAVLRVPGGQELRAAIADISRGGVALRTDWWAAAGTEVQVVLPAGSSAVTARTVRSENGGLALAFRQDEAMLRRVDAALEQISARGLPMAA